MITQEQVPGLIGAQLVSTSGEQIGKVGQIFLDDQTGRPEWATVNTGFFGNNESFVPLAEAEASNGEIRVPYHKDRIKGAPNVEVDRGHLDQSEEAELYRYYGLDYSETRSDTGRDVSGPETDNAMTRSEERLRARTETATAGTARLRKWVETEQQQVSVPVKKEKARLVTEPVTDENRGAAMDGPDISEAEHEVTLTEERPVVAKETVPVERVRLEKDVEVDEHQMSEDVRKERIDAEGVDVTGDRTTTGR